ncbi:RNA polymerase subunit Rpo13 [Ignicoccus hospitalis]|uniref:RNA polymerase Rpo13 subunit HTH domain-containing protein n=1 Tax=Ignicoccus hospitalis (strain KIN4/I / DSM 18386 / JCM 14125) TaxID=453591 RepID=A8AB08_IGNH4|nr:RNA polymerase subunit Rpo13 [Ignicoccus hospitalis]ABU82110.1 hypothetical protein Igni_0930 [Ignicoccus hospitalis KIN4/I]HIH91068.1 hypothetical protein [Desulfurococcaceae archaeon]
MSYEEEPFLFGESETTEEAPLVEEEEGTKAPTTERFPLEAYEISVELADLWDGAIEGKVSLEELKETMQALQSLVSTGRRRRRRR